MAASIMVKGSWAGKLIISCQYVAGRPFRVGWRESRHELDEPRVGQSNPGNVMPDYVFYHADMHIPIRSIHLLLTDLVVKVGKRKVWCGCHLCVFIFQWCCLEHPEKDGAPFGYWQAQEQLHSRSSARGDNPVWRLSISYMQLSAGQNTLFQGRVK